MNSNKQVLADVLDAVSYTLQNKGEESAPENHLQRPKYSQSPVHTAPFLGTSTHLFGL